jgi:Flp pilus assembly protein TadG
MIKVFNKNKQKGAAMVEFALTAFIFFMIIFATFEIGLMILVKNGLEAGQFYSSRQAITGGYTNNQIQSVFIEYFNKYSYADYTKLSLVITRYPDLQSLHTNTSPSSTEGNVSNAVYLYESSYPYTYITSFLAPLETRKNLTLKKAIWNEKF